MRPAALRLGKNAARKPQTETGPEQQQKRGAPGAPPAPRPSPSTCPSSSAVGRPQLPLVPGPRGIQPVFFPLLGSAPQCAVANG
jgi:hypothetical protein